MIRKDEPYRPNFMVQGNRYDWQMFLEVTGPGGSGKTVLASIATLLAGYDNATSATIDMLESFRERASVVGFSLIILPDQEKWSGDGAGIKPITGSEVLEIKRQTDPLVDFCGYLMPISTPNVQFMGNANARPLSPERYLYHAYLSLWNRAAISIG